MMIQEHSPVMQIVSTFLSRLAAAAALLFLLAGNIHATGGSLRKVTMDYGGILGLQLTANQTLTIPAGINYTIYVWKTSEGTAPWTFKLTAPSGATLAQTTDGNETFMQWSGWQIPTIDPVGQWTAQMDDGPTFSWTIANPPPPALSSLSTAPSTPFGMQPFVLTVTGSNFAASSNISISGPGCPCATVGTITKTATTISATFILRAGSYTVSASNSGSRQSNSLPLTVNELVPSISGISTSPSPPLVGQNFTLTVRGSNFTSDARILISGPGCAPCIAPFPTVTSDTLTVPTAIRSSGTFTVAVQNGAGGTLSNSLSLTVVPGNPTIATVSTSPLSPNAGTQFTLTVTGTDFDPGTVQIIVSGPGCSFTCITPNSSLVTKTASTLSAPITLANSGTFFLSVNNGSAGQQSNVVQFTVGIAIPTIASVTTSPSPPRAGRTFTLTINGANFDPATAAILVSGPGCGACGISNGGLTTKTATVLGGGLVLTGSGVFTVSVKNYAGAASNGVSFSVAPSTPTISGISPSTAQQRQVFLLRVTGDSFDPSTALIVITGPGCSPCTIANSDLSGPSSNSLAGFVTLNSFGTFSVSVQNGAGGPQSAGLPLTVVGVNPRITGVSIAPNPGVPGQPFTVTLTGSDFDPPTAQIVVSGPGCSPCTITNGALAIKTSDTLAGPLTVSQAGIFTVGVRNGSGGTDSTFSFTVRITVPAITGLSTSPAAAVAGQQFTLTVAGNNFDATTARIVVSGPGCAPCNLLNAALTTKTSSTLAGPLTLDSGTYAVLVQNGDGSQSNSLFLAVGAVPPAISQGGVVSAASFQQPLSRGSVACLFGTDLASEPATADQVPLPRTLGGVRIQVGGMDAPLWFVSAKQINFQVPFESPLSGPVTVVVIRDGVSSLPFSVALQPYAPGIFMYERTPGVLDPIITHTDGALVTPENPAAPGSSIVAWGTGIGDLSPIPSTGALTPALPTAGAKVLPVITIMGVPAEAQFAGLTGGSIGLAQFNIRVPDALPTASTGELVIQFGNAASRSVMLALGQK